MRSWRIVIVCLGALSWSVSAQAADPIGSRSLPPAAEEPVDFARDIEPLFRKRCYTCHGPEVQESGLRLDLRRQALAGGESGRVILPGDSAGSALVLLVAGVDSEGRRMPPEKDGPPLAREQIARIRTWIDKGAKWPESSRVETEHTIRRDLWSFQPVRRPSLPAVKNTDWPRNPIDRFVLNRLEANSLLPASPVDKAALVRRATFDLLGLPPDPNEVDAFVLDESPTAWPRLVEQLLANPHHGERWGRHWLDLVRYADTNGYEVDGIKPFAWKYRDYVLGAFNDDLPYDQFVLQQLAGDELPTSDTNSIIATGYYRVGPWDAERGASVQPSEVIAERYNELDDMVSTTSQVFLGLTLGCARCHNHKFDPLTAKDYYSLAAIFNPLTRHRNGREELALPAVPAAALAAKPAEEHPQGYFMRESPQPTAMHVLTRGNPNQPGQLVLPAVPAVLVAEQPPFAPPDSFTSRRRISLARWIVDPRNPLTARVIVNRVWQYHFGQGLVRTSSDFGHRGDLPSHPELLDWLADWFIHEGNWSLKRLHFLIMTSSTYGMSKQWRAEPSERDPDNRLLWRFPVHRLELEAIRDALLKVSGQLNEQMLGPGMYPNISEDARRSGYFPDKVWKASPERDAARRTIYAFVKRTLIVPMFDVLDFCDTARSADKREITTVAPQALTLFNGEFVNRQAEHFADRLLREVGDDSSRRIATAYRLAFGRSPSASEQQLIDEFLQFETERLLAEVVPAQDVKPSSEPTAAPVPSRAEQARRAALVQVCRVILNMNEFVYTD